MAEPKIPPKPAERGVQKIVFKYPSEDETYVRRLGASVLALWSTLPPELKTQILAEANMVWDREYNVPQLSTKLDAFVKRHPSRLSKLV
jgi:hypothetical protein